MSFSPAENFGHAFRPKQLWVERSRDVAKALIVRGVNLAVADPRIELTYVRDMPDDAPEGYVRATRDEDIDYLDFEQSFDRSEPGIWQRLMDDFRQYLEEFHDLCEPSPKT